MRVRVRIERSGGADGEERIARRGGWGRGQRVRARVEGRGKRVRVRIERSGGADDGEERIERGER